MSVEFQIEESPSQDEEDISLATIESQINVEKSLNLCKTQAEKLALLMHLFDTQVEKHGKKHYLVAVTLINFANLLGDLNQRKDQKKYLTRGLKKLHPQDIPEEYKKTIALKVATA